MATQKYSPDFLYFLRKSPLISKPHGLPSIEQWMDNASTIEPSQRRARPSGTRPDELLLNNDKQAQRPALMQSRSAARVNSGSAGDTFLGPPKTAFASASRITSKTSDLQSNPNTSQDDDLSTPNKPDFQSRFFGDKNSDRQNANGRRFGREDGDGWTNVRNRKSSAGQEDAEKVNRGEWSRDRPLGRGERDKHGNDPERRPGRVGMGRARHESGSWRTPPASAGLDGEWEGQTRNVLNDRDRRTNRDFRVEQEPEWLDEPEAAFESTTKADNKPKTAEDFQRWKDQMKGARAETEKKVEDSGDAPTNAKDANNASKITTPVTVDEGLGKLSGWGFTQTAEAKGDGLKSTTAQPKSSRFRSFFGPKEQSSHSQIELQADATSNTSANGKDADKEGFNLIMRRLVQSSSGPEESGIAANPMSALFDNMTDSKERSHERQTPDDEQHGPRTSGLNRWSPESQRQSLGQNPTPKAENFSHTPHNENFLQDLDNLTTPRNQQPERQSDAKRDLLLSLMRNQPSNALQQSRLPPPQPPDDPDFQIFLTNESPQQPAPRSSRGPPSGFFDERFANDFDRQQQQQHPPKAATNYEQEILGRRPSQPQRGPNNFFDDPAISNFQRRNQIPEQEQRFQGNPIGMGPNLSMFDPPFPGPPQQHLQQQHSSQAQPSQQRQDVVPPPGFNLPPFRNPQQQPPPLSAGFPPGFNTNQGNFGVNRNLPPLDGHPGLNRQMSLPPGGGPNGPPPHMFAGGPPPGAPPGFFNNAPPSAPPPGFPGFPGGPQAFGPDGLPGGRGGGIQNGMGGGQQGNGRSQPFGMDGRMFR